RRPRDQPWYVRPAQEGQADGWPYGQRTRDRSEPADYRRGQRQEPPAGQGPGARSPAGIPGDSGGRKAIQAQGEVDRLGVASREPGPAADAAGRPPTRLLRHDKLLRTRVT